MIKGRLCQMLLICACVHAVLSDEKSPLIASSETAQLISPTLEAMPLPPDEKVAQERGAREAAQAEQAKKTESVAVEQPLQELPVVDEDTGEKLQAQQVADAITQERQEKQEEIELTPLEKAHIKKSIEQPVELNFNNVSLQSIVDQVSAIFNISFLPDDVVKVPDKQIKALAESKISFKTHRSFSRQQAWSLFTKFLELAGWSLVPTSDPQFYRITAIDVANKSPLPTYINTPLEVLPKTDQRIRYVYFLANSTPAEVEPVIKQISTSKTLFEKYTNLRAILLTDTANNIASLLRVVQELDKATDAQVISVINLREADANEVLALMNSLQKQDEPSQSPWMPIRKEASLYYFPKDVRMVAVPRTNSLVIIGPKEGVERFEHFIVTHVDASLKQAYQPLNVYELSYAPAQKIAEILNEVVQFGKKSAGGTSSVGDVGGVLGGLKYFGDVHVEAEKEGNRLLVYASQEDFKHLSNVIKQLDQRQPQVAIEVMIVEIDVDNLRRWGMQWDTRVHRTFDAQMTGFWGQKAVVNQTPNSPSALSNNLIGNLISLATVPEAGTLLMTLGKESVYAIFGMLQDDEYARVIANPFVVATNKYTATVGIAEERLAQTQIITGTTKDAQGYNTVNAEWSIGITPQINTEGTVNLDIDVTIEDFTSTNSSTAGASNADRKSRKVQTNANVADKEVIALGGLINRKKTLQKSQIPILGSLPIIGNIFKNEYHRNIESILVIFMSPTIIQPTEELTNVYTRNKAAYIKQVSQSWHNQHEATPRDPVYRWLFKQADQDVDVEIDAFMQRGTKKMAAVPPTPHVQTQQEETGKNVLMQSVSEHHEQEGNQ